MTGIKRKIWTLIRGGSFNGYLRTVSGHPLTLTDCMAVQPMSLAASGNAVQDGTPSPDNPVEVQGVGERTANLFDKDGTATEYPTNSALFYYTVGGFHGEPYGYKVPLMFSGKNLFDVKNASVIAGVVNSTSLAFVAGGTGRYTYFKCRQNTTYVISKLPQGGIYCTSDSPPFEGKKCNKRLPANGDNITTSTAVITTGDNDAYIWVALIPIIGGVYTAEEMIDSIQIEQGDAVTPYEPYHEPQTHNIYLDAPLYGYDGYFDEIRIDTATKNARLVQKIGVLSPPKATSIIATSNTNQTRFTVNHGGNTPRVGSIDKCNIASSALSASGSNPCTVNSGANKAVYIWILNSYVGIADDDTNSVKIAKANTFLEQHNAKIYYQLATPVITDISDKIDWDSIPKLWRGTVIVTADTEIKPTSIAVEYYADKPGGGD